MHLAHTHLSIVAGHILACTILFNSINAVVKYLSSSYNICLSNSRKGVLHTKSFPMNLKNHYFLKVIFSSASFHYMLNTVSLNAFKPGQILDIALATVYKELQNNLISLKLYFTSTSCKMLFSSSLIVSSVTNYQYANEYQIVTVFLSLFEGNVDLKYVTVHVI
jgi:hypothetical protein